MKFGMKMSAKTVKDNKTTTRSLKLLIVFFLLFKIKNKKEKFHEKIFFIFIFTKNFHKKFSQNFHKILLETKSVEISIR